MKTRKYTLEKKKSKVKEGVVAYANPVEVTPYSVLGLERKQLREPLSRITIFRQGLEKQSFEKLKEVTGLDNETLASALAVSAKTIQRTEVFDVVQSERMYALAELYSLGVTYFGLEGFRRWMDRPLFSIGNIRPLELIDVSEGIVLLKTEIMRMQHGIAV
jgi:putative toxin-antitoxin system antitoxin component (TIGR02293 family)